MTRELFIFMGLRARAFIVLCSLMPVGGFLRPHVSSMSLPPEGSPGGAIHPSSPLSSLHGGSMTRGDILKGSVGGLALGVVGLPLGPVSAAQVRRSPKELQYELFKKALDLTHAFQYEEAEAVYTDIIQLFGDVVLLSERDKFLVARAYSNRGNVRSMLNQIERALVDYSKALELAPDCAEFWLNRALSYESIADGVLPIRERDAMQFYEAAMQDYEHAIVLDPNNHRLYLNAGDVLTRLAKHEQALENYQRAVALFPMSPASRAKIALMEVQLGNIERATFIVDAIIRRNPDFAEMVLASAAIDWNFGRFSEGMDMYSVAIERDPRLLDDNFLKMALHWPPAMLNMVRHLRDAGATKEGNYRARNVVLFRGGREI